MTQPFYLGVFEVTQEEYKTVVDTNPSYFAKTGPDKLHVAAVEGLDTARHPVENVSWNEMSQFCDRLDGVEKLPPPIRAAEVGVPKEATGYRLPTEVEWEFSCRAGTTTNYWAGESEKEAAKAAWFSANFKGRTHAVGELQANPFGLFDVHGNVWEAVQEPWTAFDEKAPDKPAVVTSVESSTPPWRVFRGGGWFRPAVTCRSTQRLGLDPAYGSFDIGFRVALSVDAVRQALKTTGPAVPPRAESSPSRGATTDPEDQRKAKE